jgi:hypothetical protein
MKVIAMRCWARAAVALPIAAAPAATRCLRPMDMKTPFFRR